MRRIVHVEKIVLPQVEAQWPLWLLVTVSVCFCVDMASQSYRLSLLSIWWTVYIEGGISLVPRPSHCPVFDCLQFAERKGEALVDFISWITPLSTYIVGRRSGGRGAWQRNELEAFIWSVCPSAWVPNSLFSSFVFIWVQRRALN